MQHETVPVIDAQEHVIGVLKREDLLPAHPDAAAITLARTDYLVAYEDEVVHDVASRFLDQTRHQAVVLDTETGKLVGMLTAFDILKAKDWELMQEMTEPSHLVITSFFRFGARPTAGTERSEPR